MGRTPPGYPIPLVGRYRSGHASVCAVEMSRIARWVARLADASRRRMLLAVVGSGACCAMVLSGAGVPSWWAPDVVPIATAVGAPHPGSTCSGVSQQQIASAMQEVYARISESPWFTGIAASGNCGPVDVYMTRVDPAVVTAALGGLSPVGYRFHKVAHDLKTLLAVQDEITRAYSALSAQGMRIYRYWPDMTTGMERVELTDASPAQLREISRLFGASLVDPVTIHDPVEIGAT